MTSFLGPPAGKTLLVHLEALAGFEAHALFRRFNRLPAFVLKQGNDLRGGNEGVAGRDTRPGGRRIPREQRGGDPRTKVQGH